MCLKSAKYRVLAPTRAGVGSDKLYFLSSSLGGNGTLATVNSSSRNCCGKSLVVPPHTRVPSSMHSTPLHSKQITNSIVFPLDDARTPCRGLKQPDSSRKLLWLMP